MAKKTFIVASSARISESEKQKTSLEYLKEKMLKFKENTNTKVEELVVEEVPIVANTVVSEEIENVLIPIEVNSIPVILKDDIELKNEFNDVLTLKTYQSNYIDVINNNILKRRIIKNKFDELDISICLDIDNYDYYYNIFKIPFNIYSIKGELLYDFNKYKNDLRTIKNIDEIVVSRNIVIIQSVSYLLESIIIEKIL